MLSFSAADTETSTDANLCVGSDEWRLRDDDHFISKMSKERKNELFI